MLLVKKYQYNHKFGSYCLVSQTMIDEDRVNDVVTTHIQDVHFFYKYEVTSESGNILHEIYSTKQSIFQ